MNAFFGYFQLVALAVFLLVFAGRSVYLRFCRNINPFALGVGKRGLRRAVEIGFLVIFALWATEILVMSLALDWRILPVPLQRQFVDTLSAQIAGVALVIVTEKLVLSNQPRPGVNLSSSTNAKKPDVFGPPGDGVEK